MNAAWWLMAAYHELGEPSRAPDEPLVELPTIITPDRSVRLACPKCGRTGRGIVIHIRNCKG